MVLGSYSLLISSLIIIKFVMNKAGVTDYIYFTWCSCVDDMWRDRDSLDKAEALLNNEYEIYTKQILKKY